MSDDIEVHFDPQRGHLSLACGEEAFSRIRDLIFEEALIPEIVGPLSLDAWQIEVLSAPAIVTRRRKLSRWWPSLGVGMATMAALFVFGVGLWTILRWVLQRLA
jgi:hypothetical protein